MDYKYSTNTIFDTEKLIEAVRKRECLYSKYHIKYRNRDYVHKMWSEIAAEIGHSEKICKDKWANLRSNYQRELRKFKTRDPSIKPWPYLNILRFLDPYLESRELSAGAQYPDEIETKDTINTLNTMNIENLTIPLSPSEVQLPMIDVNNKLQNSFSSKSSSSSSSTRKRKKFNDTIDTKFLSELKKIRESLQNKFTNTNHSNDFNIDDDTCFLLSLRTNLSSLSSTNNMIFKIECQKLMQQLLLQSNNNDIKGFNTYS